MIKRVVVRPFVDRKFIIRNKLLMSRNAKPLCAEPWHFDSLHRMTHFSLNGFFSLSDRIISARAKQTAHGSVRGTICPRRRFARGHY